MQLSAYIYFSILSSNGLKSTIKIGQFLPLQLACLASCGLWHNSELGICTLAHYKVQKHLNFWECKSVIYLVILSEQVLSSHTTWC